MLLHRSPATRLAGRTRGPCPCPSPTPCIVWQHIDASGISKHQHGWPLATGQFILSQVRGIDTLSRHCCVCALTALSSVDPKPEPRLQHTTLHAKANYWRSYMAGTTYHVALLQLRLVDCTFVTLKLMHLLSSGTSDSSTAAATHRYLPGSHLSASMMVCSLCATASRVRSLNSVRSVSCSPACQTGRSLFVCM